MVLIMNIPKPTLSHSTMPATPPYRYSREIGGSCSVVVALEIYRFSLSLLSNDNTQKLLEIYNMQSPLVIERTFEADL